MELKNRPEMESEFSLRAKRLFQEHRRQLLKLMGNPPDFRNVPLSFWNKVEEDEEALLAVILLIIFSESAMQHGLNDQLSAQLAKPYVSIRSAHSARGIAENSAANALVLQRNNGPLNRASASEIAEQIFSDTRAEGLITTEFTAASVAGGEAAMHIRGLISDMDVWITHPTRTKSGVCKVCKPLHETIRKLWGRVFPLGPPVHPHCECEIRYANEVN